MTSATNSTGLEAYVRLDESTYPAKISNAELKTVNLNAHEVHPEGNYVIRPRGR